MRFGAPFWGTFATRDPLAIRDYAQAVEGMGYEYLFMDEVLLNDNPQEIFHESLTLFAVLHQTVEGYRWQTVPAYALTANVVVTAAWGPFD